METNWKLQCSLQEANPKCEICSNPHVYTANKWYLVSTKMTFLVIWHLPVFCMYYVGLLFKYNIQPEQNAWVEDYVVVLYLPSCLLYSGCRLSLEDLPRNPNVMHCCISVDYAPNACIAYNCISPYCRREGRLYTYSHRWCLPYWCLLNECMLTWHTNYIHTYYSTYSLNPGKSMCAILCIHASSTGHIPEFTREIFINDIKHSNWQADIA